MPRMDASWESRLLNLWRDIDRYEQTAFVAEIESLMLELPSGSPLGLFERASAQDSTGHPDVAIPLYRAALEGGLDGLRRRRATIQLASSLRSLGYANDAVALLRTELDAASDELDDAVRAFLALALVDLGHEREAAAIVLAALSKYLPRYNRSLARYASEIATSRTGNVGAP